MTKRKMTLRCLCEGALLLALAQVLGYLKLWELPNGGSVTLSMLPIFLFCVRWGFGPGMIVAFARACLSHSRSAFCSCFSTLRTPQAGSRSSATICWRLP